MTSQSSASARMFWPALSLVILTDVATKYLAHTQFASLRLPREILGETIRITLLYNPGAAFGLHLGPDSRWIFLGITLGALVLLGQMYRQTPATDRWRALALGLITGGAAGNLVNRLWSAPGVVDFIDIGIGSLRWPAFNVADIGITLGALLLLCVLWAEDQRPPGQSPPSDPGPAEWRRSADTA